MTTKIGEALVADGTTSTMKGSTVMEGAMTVAGVAALANPASTIGGLRILSTADLGGGGGAGPAFDQANAAFAQANNAYSQSNLAFTSANTANVTGQTAISLAIAGNTYAQTIFTLANTANNNAANALPAGSNTQIQFKGANGFLAASANLTFNIASNTLFANVASTNRGIISSVQPRMFFEDTDGASGGKVAEIRYNSNSFSIIIDDDTFGGLATIMSAVRGTVLGAVDNTSFFATQVFVPTGNLIVGLAASSNNMPLEVRAAQNSVATFTGSSTVPLTLGDVGNINDNTLSCFIGPSRSGLAGINGDLVFQPRTSTQARFLYYANTGAATAQVAVLDNSGRYFIGDGTVANPAYSFLNGASYGMSRGGGTLMFSAGGLEVLRTQNNALAIKTGGVIGSGTATEYLSIQDSVGEKGWVGFGNAGSNNFAVTNATGNGLFQIVHLGSSVYQVSSGGTHQISHPLTTSARVLTIFSAFSTGVGPYVTWQNNSQSIGDVGEGKQMGGSFTANSMSVVSRSGFVVEMAANGRTTPDLRIASANSQIQIPFGDIANPGLAFLGDTDTGLQRVASNILDVVAGAQQIVAFRGDLANPAIQAESLGSTSVPAFSFTSKTSSGMYHDGTYLALSSSGNTVMQFNTGAAIISGGCRVFNQDGGSGNPSYSFLTDQTSGMLRVSASVLGFAVGGVLAAKIDVGYIGATRASQSTSEVGFRVEGGTSGVTWYMYQPVGSDRLAFYNSAVANLMTLDRTSGGGVAILGTPVAGVSLKIGGTNGNPGLELSTLSATKSYFQCFDRTLSVYAGVDYYANNHNFWVSGFASGSYALTVRNDGIIKGGDSAAGALAFSGAEAAEFVSGLASWGVGIVAGGTSTGTLGLQNNAASGNNLWVQFYEQNNLRGSITYNRAGAVVAYNTTSDIRLKKNIADALSAGERIDLIRIRSFNWKENDYHTEYGLVAQELYEVFPYAVTKGTETEEILPDPDKTNANQIWSVDASKMVPMLIKEIQDLRKRVNTLESGGN